MQPEMFLVAYKDDRIRASVMAGYEGHRGWINYLSAHPDFQGTGVGRRTMQEAEKLLQAAGCPKINLQVRSTSTKVIEF